MNDESEVRQAISFLKSVALVLDYQSKPSLANQGQCLDGFAALANYNALAVKIKRFLDEQIWAQVPVPRDDLFINSK